MRRSRSVRIPRLPSRSSTTAHVWPVSVMSRATVAIGVSGPQRTAGARSSAATGRSGADSPGRGTPAVGRPRSVRVTCAQRLRPGEQRAGDVAREAVALRLAAGARGEAGRQLREHRGEAEQLAGTEEVEHAAVVDELDAPRADDPHARLRRRALGEDRLAVGERADLRRAGEPLRARPARGRRTAGAPAGTGRSRPSPVPPAPRPLPQVCASAASISARCSGSGSAGLSRWTK